MAGSGWLVVHGLRRLVRSVLLVSSVLLTAYGLVYWASGFPVGWGILWLCSSFGMLLGGSGLLLTVPTSRKVLVSAGLALSVSSALLLGLWFTSPWHPSMLALSGLAAIEAVVSFIIATRLSRRR